MHKSLTLLASSLARLAGPAKPAWLAGLLALAGCQTSSVVTTTQTGLGVSLSENPATGLYEARLGYFRNEVCVVPGQTNGPAGAAGVPDVLMELRLEQPLKGGAVYQRLAVGSQAVAQPGAAVMFLRNGAGEVTSNSLEVLKFLRATPDLR